MAYGYDPKLEAEIHAQSTGRPFKKCTGCKITTVPASATYCNECKRLYAMGMKTPPVVVSDTQEAQSFPSDDHSGFSTTAPSGKFPKGKERV